MSVAATSYYPQVNANILAGSEWLPPAFPVAAPPDNEAKELHLNIEFPEFGISFGTVLDEIDTNKDYSVVNVSGQIGPGVFVLITLHNKVEGDAGNLVIKSVSINFNVTEHKARAHFIASSLYAQLALAGQVGIMLPELNVDLKANFIMPLPEISKLLQSRQIYFGIMIIERATRTEFEIPEFITSEDMNSISFSYHAIVERQFIWLVNFITLPVPATKESLEWITSLKPTESGGSVYRLSFGPEPTSRQIFGHIIELGPETVFIEDGVFRNLGDVIKGIRQLDGHIVPVVIRPISGLGRYVFSSPPLPPTEWEEKILILIALEEQLNQRLSMQYNSIAASTLAGLTPEEIELVTARPDPEETLLIDEQ